MARSIHRPKRKCGFIGPHGDDLNRAGSLESGPANMITKELNGSLLRNGKSDRPPMRCCQRHPIELHHNPVVAGRTGFVPDDQTMAVYLEWALHIPRREAGPWPLAWRGAAVLSLDVFLESTISGAVTTAIVSAAARWRSVRDRRRGGPRRPVVSSLGERRTGGGRGADAQRVGCREITASVHTERRPTTNLTSMAFTLIGNIGRWSLLWWAELLGALEEYRGSILFTP